MEQSTGGRGSAVWAPVALFAAAFGVRALPWHGVFVDGRVLFFGSDAYYHMRRIVYSTVHFPAVLGFDPYINFPHGGQPIWSPPFDWTVAALLRACLGALSARQLEVLAAWIPPALGAATVVALYRVGRRHFGPGVAWIAGAALSVLSGHFWYSQVGFLDHHAAVALATTLLLGAAMAFLAERSPTPDRPRGPAPGALPTGLAMGACLLLWPGSLLHVALVESALLATLLCRADRGAARSLARQLVWVHGVAACVLVPAAFGTPWSEWGRFSPVVLSAFQPWYFAAATLFSAACAAAWRLDSLGGSRARRAASAAIVGAAVVTGSLVAFPDLRGAGLDAWAWIAKRDSFQTDVAESAPLLVLGGEFTLRVALVRLSGFALLAPLALGWLAASTRHRRDAAPLRLFLWWTLGLLAATLVQKRFMNSSAVALALLLALTLQRAADAAPMRWRQGAVARRSLRACWVAAAVLLLLPVASGYAFHVRNAIAAWSGRPLRLEPATLWQVTVVRMADWLRTRTPPTSGWLDAAASPEYGILAPWTIGHILEFEARRPTVTDNFGDDVGRENFLLARRYYQGDEAAAAALLDQLRVRYVVAQASASYLGGEPAPASMFFALFRRDGSESPSDAGDPAAGWPALERHRLVYESGPGALGASGGAPLFKVFEYVPGARVEGYAAPGARIRVTLPLRTRRGRELVYTTHATAAPDGRYALRLPYANRGAPPGIGVGDHYRLDCRSDSADLVVGEAAVQGRERVAGPALKCALR